MVCEIVSIILMAGSDNESQSVLKTFVFNES